MWGICLQYKASGDLRIPLNSPSNSLVILFGQFWWSTGPGKILYMSPHIKANLEVFDCTPWTAGDEGNSSNRIV